ncbi:DUF1266 domain-containing protein [Streptomyces sp. NBC_01142]|uniref:DUF1266 domain-containing protein n=1 Tax=Streptomyces sp. NBC_01142 TaxID=2975865 RepID=UPI002258E7BB|nr:DUF1266 domain-containing protein [Streptomyces sp. NBC_01142]MCX4823876.1 DUF1266 domain-containing protein [Streptomyces sp. NBC_01142]
MGMRDGGRPDDTAYAQAWRAPTDVEQRLYDAKLHGEWGTYFDVLAGARLFHAMSRAKAEADPDILTWTPYWNPANRSYCFAFLTEGLLPAPMPDPVFLRTSLGDLARRAFWDGAWMAINPGTPCEAYFPATPAHRAEWKQHDLRAPGTRQPTTLRALRVGGPLHGPVAHGLACGALLCVSNGSLWNAMGWHGTGFHSERERLLEWWGIASRVQWQAYEEQLLNGRMSDPMWEFALKIRRALADELGGAAVEAGLWRHVSESSMRGRAQETGDADGLEEAIDAVQQFIGRVTRYEARFRADGLLAENRQVRSVLAWDYGRASKMARWGLGARFCELPEAEAAVVRAGEVSKASYDSWEDFSAGYVLGRCLHFDGEEFGTWYGNMLDAHRILTTDPGSPWLNIPWK